MKRYVFLLLTLLNFGVENVYAQVIDHHFFFLNSSLIDSDPVTFDPGSKSLFGADYNEGANSGFPRASDNYFSQNVSLSPVCTLARKTVYNFRQKTGLKYYGKGSDFEDYTITVIIKFNTISTGYKRIIDFSNGTSDNGIYVLDNDLNFFPTGNVANNVFSSGNFTYLTLTRDASTKVIDVYVNDNLVTSYTDTNNDYTFSNGNIVFGRDNIPPSSATGEDGNGQIAYVQVTNTKSSATEVKDVYDNICSLIPPDVDAIDDVAPDANGKAGQVAVLNVFDNDMVDNAAAVPSNLILTETIADPNGYLTLNTDGTVDLAPNTPVGDYQLTYRICDAAFPSVCDAAIVRVSVLPIPQILTTTDNLICGIGTGALSATASAGIINWYDSLTGGVSLGTGNSFTTPTVSNTTIYYVDATENWRVTETRVPVTLTVVHVAQPTTSAAFQTFCDIENATIANLAISGTAIKWYDDPMAGNLLSTSDLLASTTYYATQTINLCESFPRVAIDVTIFKTVVGLTPSNVPPLESCDSNIGGSDTNGITTFDLTNHESILLNGENPADFSFLYYTDAAYSNLIGTPDTAFENTIIGGQTIYARILNVLDATCYTDVSFNLLVHALPTINSPIELKQCDNDTDGISLFNLTETNSLISANSANETFTYYLTDAQAQTGLVADQIANFTAYPNPTPLNSVVYTRVENSNGCYRTSRIDLVVGVSQIPSSFNTLVYTVCDDELVDGDKRNGIATFDFSDATQIIENLFPLPRNFEITYYNNEADALAELNAIVDISNHRNDGYPNSQDIYVRIDSDVVNACLGLGHHITLNVETLPVANPVNFVQQCDDIPIDTEITSAFDTSSLEADILLGQTNVSLSYFKADGSPLTDASGTLITSPFPNSFRTASQIITVKATNVITNTDNNTPCDDETTIEFIVDQAPIANPIVIAAVCDDGLDDTDGLHEFDTSTIESTLLGSQTGMVVSYFDGNNNILPSPLPNPFNSVTQTITVTVENPINTTCIATTTFDLIVNPLPEFTLDTPRIICESGPASTITLDIYQDDTSEALDYSWTDENGDFISSSQSIDVTASGTYSVTLTKTDGTNCSRTREIFVVYSEKATITLDDITIVDDSDNNTITINNEGINLGQGDYEFSLDDDFVGYQDEPYFDFVEAGIHTIYLRDKNGCGVTAIEISVIGFPKFFTPNNDGHNDTWEVKGLSADFYPSSIILIFDRFGKVIAKVDPNGGGWNGYYNGQELPSTDYWFSVQLTDKNGEQRNRKGHFSMIQR